MELFQAHQQWATRPADQRFTSIRAMRDACKAYADQAREAEDVPLRTLKAIAVDDDVAIAGANHQALLTHWAFGQACARAEAPAGYLRTLPSQLAVENLNYGLARRVAAEPDATTNLLIHRNGGLLIRAMTSDRYARIWNWELGDRLLELESRGWEPTRPDVRQIDDRLPLYASDHDMFAFVRHQDRVVREPGNPAGLQRGLIVSNSEVGASKLRLMWFLYREMCGNHIIWGAEDVAELSLRHVGSIRERMSAWGVEIRRYMDRSAGEQEEKIVAAQSRRIAATKDQVLDLLFGKRIPGLTRKALEAGYAAVVPDQDGDPRSQWGIVQGLTRYSQQTAYADERTIVDVAAGKILSMTF